MAVLPGSPPSPAPPAQANLLPRFGLNLENHSCSPPVRGLGSKRPCGGRAPSADHTPEKTLARAEVDSLFIKVLFFRARCNLLIPIPILERFFCFVALLLSEAVRNSVQDPVQDLVHYLLQLAS